MLFTPFIIRASYRSEFPTCSHHRLFQKALEDSSGSIFTSLQIKALKTRFSGVKYPLDFSLIYPLVMGSLDYCNSLLYDLPRKNVNKLQCPQNMAARLIRNTPRFCQITPVLYQLHWLPISVRIKFKVILIRFKAIHGLVPYYMQNLIEVKETSSYNFRSNDELFLAPQTFKSKKISDRAFQMAAPTLWNKLPSALRIETSLKPFKAKLKTLLFNEVYDL